MPLTETDADYWTCGGCGHEGKGPDQVEWYQHTQACQAGRVIPPAATDQESR